MNNSILKFLVTNVVPGVVYTLIGAVIVMGIVFIALPAVPAFLRGSSVEAAPENANISGNIEYIPIDQWGNPAKNNGYVLAAISNWETQNPNRILVSFNVAQQQDSYGFTASYTYGVYIYSRLK